jgi:hypothetical protein
LNSINFKLNNISVKPEKVTVRTYVNLFLSFKIDTFLPMNTLLTFRIRGGRRNKNDWYYLQPFDKNHQGFLEIKTNPVKKVIPIQITGKELAVTYIISDKDGIKEGSSFQFNIYDTLVQSLVEKNKKFEILIKKPNNKLITIENPPQINITNGQFDHITIICPSVVKIDEELKILIRIEDISCNLVEEFSDKIELFKLSNSNPIRTIKIIEITQKNKGLKIESDLSFQESGIYLIEVFYKNEYFQSNPIMCVDDNYPNRVYWGYIHGHTNKSDGIRDPESYFNNLINSGLDFGTTTEHDHIWETSDDDFEELKRINERFNSKNFVTLFGYEWGYWYTGYGDTCIYFSEPKLPILRSDNNKYNSIEKLTNRLRPLKDKVLLIAHHTALRPGYRNWDHFDNTIERLVEIYSTWGNQEYSHKEGNPLPPRYKFFGNGKFAPKKGPIIEKRGSFVQDALIRGYKLGFTAGGDDHFGLYPSGPFNPNNGLYPSGIMAIWSKNLNRESLWNALLNRKCYGTTGPRVIIEFGIDNSFMGDILDVDTVPTTLQSRTIKLKIISPLNIEMVEIIRNNKLFTSQIVKSKSFESEFLDSDYFQRVCQLHYDKKEKFIFYYPRIHLSNNNMAWASPIWIVQKL